MTSTTSKEMQHSLTSLESDPTNELAWRSFAAFINSGSSGDPSETSSDGFKHEPDEDDYIRYGIVLVSRTICIFKASA